MKLLQRRMVLREISPDLFLALVTGKTLYLTYIFVLHEHVVCLFPIHTCNLFTLVVSTCIPAQCMRCNITGETTAGKNKKQVTA